MIDALLSQQLRDAYACIAERYADVNATMPPAVLEAIKRFVTLLPVSKEQALILDLGCGAGRDSTWLAQLGYQVISLDLSYVMLVQAQLCGVPHAFQADMCTIPLSSGSVSAIWANASILHIPSTLVTKVLRQCHRVLIDGGLIFLAMQVGHGEVWEDVSYGHDASRFFARYQPSEFSMLLEQAGFRIQHFEEQSVSSARHWMHFYAHKSN